jgi:glycosyltransferase involved in cell wall biosynthesis
LARIGINPARGKISDYRPARVTVTVVTYIPSLDGYFANRLEILKLVFSSLAANTSPAHDLMVFDNGSCQEVVDYLLELKSSGQIDYLLLSKRNIGKIGALQVLFHAAPGEVIAYNDDDILFYKGWLEACLEILDQYPKAGVVSGLPVRNASTYARDSLDQLSSNPPPGMIVTNERRIPDEWEADWAQSTGRDAGEFLQSTSQRTDLVFSLTIDDRGAGESKVLEAICGANHFQFVTRKQVILQMLPGEWSGKLMGSMVELDENIDQKGYLRLSTAGRFTRHLGNTLNPEVLAETGRLGLPQSEKSPIEKTSSKLPSLLRIPGSRRLLTALYHWLFDLLYR